MQRRVFERGERHVSHTSSKNDASGADGTADVTFDSTQGAATSTIAGSFSATTCAATIDENDTCK